jgi:hypothetical protein
MGGLAMKKSLRISTLCGVLLILGMLFSLTACKPSSEAAQTPESVQAQTPLPSGRSLDFETSLTSDGEGIIITKYTGEGGDVHIPAIINGLPVQVVGSYSFSKNTTITSVTLKEGLIGIGNGAFKGCSNLATITLPASIKYIGEEGFFNCTTLVSVHIPDSVEKKFDFQQRAFMGCNNLSSETREWLQKLEYPGPFLI